jgi:hypothetical protein
MLTLELPQVNVLSKVDLVPAYGELGAWRLQGRGAWRGGGGCLQQSRAWRARVCARARLPRVPVQRG